MAAKKSQQRLSDQRTAQINIPPHSLEAEQAVLGGVLLGNQYWNANEIWMNYKIYWGKSQKGGPEKEFFVEIIDAEGIILVLSP